MSDPFMTRRDYAKGILYSSRRVYLCEESSVPDLPGATGGGSGWQDGDRIHPPRALMSKSQVRRELMRKRRASQGPQVLKRMPFLEKIQAASDKSQLTRAVQDRRMKERAERIKAMNLAEEKSLKRLSAAEAIAKANATISFTSSSSSSSSEIANMRRTFASTTRRSSNSPKIFKGTIPSSITGDELFQSGELRSGLGRTLPGNEGEGKGNKRSEGWEQVPDQGHPYWIHRAAGKMSFVNPFDGASTTLAVGGEEEEKDLSDLDPEEDNFRFLDTWRSYKTPKYIRNYTFTS